MNWFWRAVIALAAGGVWLSFVFPFMSFVVIPTIRNTVWFVLIQVALALILQIIAVAVYGLLTHRYYNRRLNVAETLCRECGYILRGITEPRCPECGERI
jgi:hypothetical protein